MNYGLMTTFGFLFIFLMTTLGAFVVLFFKKEISSKVNSIFLGLASGIMVAASVWSLIIPAIDGAEYMGKFSFIPALAGIILGSGFILLLEKVIKVDDFDINGERLKKCKKLFVAVTVHNIPEGLAVGFAFGMAATIGEDSAYLLAMGLAIGIGIQNFPEGAALSLPIKSVTGSRSKGLLYGTLSGVVEPIGAVIGFFLASFLTLLQPWFLSFAAGAMLYVVVDDLIIDAHIKEKPIYSSFSFIIGFIIMMTLDVTLG